jgi:hypothetical protein
MNDAIPESWHIFMEQYPQFIKPQHKLRLNDWYIDRAWVMFVGYYHAGIYAQIYKSHWHNHTLDGIHFETGMDADSLARKTLQLDLHIGHRNLFDREKFNLLTIPAMAEVVETWDSKVKFSKTNLSERLSLKVDFTKTGFAQQIAAGFAQMCSLGLILDDGLAQL